MTAPTAPPRKPMIQINVDRDLLVAVDRAADRARLTRTAWMVTAALAALPEDLRAEVQRDRD